MKPFIPILEIALVFFFFANEDVASVEPGVLMVGNSYTAGVQAYLRNMLDGQINNFATYTPGGMTFYGHTQNPTGHFNSPPNTFHAVVFQEQSRVGGLDNYYSKWASQQLAEKADAIGSSSCFFMTWGRRDGDSAYASIFPDFLTMNQRLLEGYRKYVELTTTPERRTVMAPVGLAFQYVYEEVERQGLVEPMDSTSDFYLLYAPDGSHPSTRGGYLAACVIYATLTGSDPRDLTYKPGGLNDQVVDSLKTAAYVTVRDEGLLTPTVKPTEAPMSSPTVSPTEAPTDWPTQSPTTTPTSSPTKRPSLRPTTEEPTALPTGGTTGSPTLVPTLGPTGAPSVVGPKAASDIGFLEMIQAFLCLILRILADLGLANSSNCKAR